MCQVNELCILNGRFGTDKNLGKNTFGAVSTIDYAMCTPDLFAYINDFTVDIFDRLLSDKHCPIIVTINVDNTKIVNQKPANTRDNITNPIVEKVKWDDSKKMDYKEGFDMDKIHILDSKIDTIVTNIVTSGSMEEISKSLNNILLEPAKSTGMYKLVKPSSKPKNVKNNQPWFNNACKISKKNYWKHRKALSKTAITEDITLKNLGKQHSKLIRQVKRKFDKEYNDRLKYLKTFNNSEYWRIINKGKKKGKMGNITLNTTREHFSELNRDSTNTPENTIELQNEGLNDTINVPFTFEEISDHIKSLKNNKSPGIDHILNEFIKHCPNELILVIVKLFNVILDSGIIPSEWTIGIIKPLYKNKGDINDINNYRGITLLSCLGKLFTSVINTRLYAYLTNENILGNEQVGFRAKHSTLDHIFALHILINYYIAQKKQLYCAFVDYSKAFDFIDRTYLWQKVLDSNIDGKIFNIIRNMYANAKSHVSLNNELSEAFPCQVGVRQGENLSPLLFAIFLNDFKTFLSDKYEGLTKVSTSILGELNIYFKIFCLLYADDTLVLAESDTQLQKALDGLHNYCNKWSLKVNTDKTKVIIFSAGKITRFKSFKFGENSIDVVEDYVYLGTKFMFNGKFHRAMATQVLQAKKSYYSLLTKAKKHNMDVDVFIDLVEKLVIPILLYGSEIWGFSDLQQLQVCLNNIMRKYLRLHKTTPMCMINGELGLKEINEYIENRMLNFWYNVATGDESKISTLLYKWIRTLYDQNTFKSDWLKHIKKSLDHMGYSHLFNDIYFVDKNHFKNSIKLRLKDIYDQKWAESVFNNSVCLNYRTMTTKKNLKKYLVDLPSQYMFALCKFKCANHKLPIVTGRYNGLPIDERTCTLCNTNEIGDEFHYLYKCVYFNDQRVKYLKRYFYTHPNMYKTEKLFNVENKKETLNLSKFIYHIMQHFKRN